MKKVCILALLFLSINAIADTTRSYQKLSPSDAVVTIQNPDRAMQAAEVIDGAEIDQFIDDLKNDKDSELYKITNKILRDHCGPATAEEDEFPCGRVVTTKAIKTEFGRFGWEQAIAAYTLFLGFVEDGSGHFFSASHTITITESAEVKEDTIVKGIELAAINEYNISVFNGFEQ